MHAPLFETDPGVREIYSRWPQKIISNDTGLELYSQAVLPQLYQFDYNFDTLIPGKFYVPAITVRELFSGATPEQIDQTILSVED